MLYEVITSIFTIQFKKGKDHFNPDDFGSTITESPMVLETEEFQVNSATNITDKKILLVEDNTELSNYRITSYNVCYTKLLRMFLHGGLINNHRIGKFIVQNHGSTLLECYRSGSCAE